MGFYGPEPFDSAEATYVWTGLGEPGFFSVTVKGHAPNFTTGITLTRDPNWVGGLRVNVMGWTGPMGPGTRAYAVHGVFPGHYLPKIVIHGANKQMAIDVKEIPFTSEAELGKRVGGLAPELENA